MRKSGRAYRRKMLRKLKRKLARRYHSEYYEEKPWQAEFATVRLKPYKKRGSKLARRYVEDVPRKGNFLRKVYDLKWEVY